MSPAERRVLLRVDRGPCHSLSRSRLSSADRSIADDLVAAGLLRVAPRSSRFPKRYVPTNAAIWGLETFEGAAGDFGLEVRRAPRGRAA